MKFIEFVKEEPQEVLVTGIILFRGTCLEMTLGFEERKQGAKG